MTTKLVFRVCAATLVLAACHSLGAQSSVPNGSFQPPRGLVGWWPGDGSAKDVIGGNDGTALAGVTFTKAMRGEGFGFDGDNGYISVPGSPSLRLTASLTIECWLLVSRLPDDRNNCGWGMIFFRGDDRQGLDPYFLAVRPDGTVVFHVEDGTSQIAELATAIPTNRFVYVAATLEDRTGEMRIYLDGRVAGQRVTRVRPFGDLDPASNPGIGIGNTQGHPASPFPEPFAGVIDELRVYSRALSPGEVHQAYAEIARRPEASNESLETVRLPLKASPSADNPEAVASPTMASTGPELRVFTAIELSWPSETNKVYRIQWTPSLEQPQWTNLEPLISGTGAEVSLFDSAREHPQGFYRVLIE